MEPLRLREQRGLLECVREIHAQRDAAHLPRALLVALGHVIPTSYSVVQEIDLRAASTGLTVQWPAELIPQWDFPRWDAHVRRDHPLPGHYARLPRSGACRLSDFLTRRRFHRTGLYVECYRPLRAEYQLIVPMTGTRPTFLRAVILNRDTSDFTERERLLLDLVRPHADVAFRNAQAYAEVQRRLHHADRALHARDLGLIVVDGRGRVRMRTERARLLERTYFGRSRPPDRLAAPLAAWMRECLSRFTRSDHVAEPPKHLCEERGDQRLVVRLLPDPPAGEHTLLLEVQPLSPSRRALDSLGLLLRETEVLKWVAIGKTNAEVAAILDLSPRTVQKHLEHIFVKLGVETRTAAAGRAWQASAGTWDGRT